jgi:hypothetical protein
LELWPFRIEGFLFPRTHRQHWLLSWNLAGRSKYSWVPWLFIVLVCSTVKSRGIFKMEYAFPAKIFLIKNNTPAHLHYWRLFMPSYWKYLGFCMQFALQLKCLQDMDASWSYALFITSQELIAYSILSEHQIQLHLPEMCKTSTVLIYLSGQS